MSDQTDAPNENDEEPTGLTVEQIKKMSVQEVMARKDEVDAVMRDSA